MRGVQVITVFFFVALAAAAVEIDEVGPIYSLNQLKRVLNFLWAADGSSYQHVWPDMEFGWRIIVGTVIAFLGAAFGSVGGVGGGGIFVPMLALIIGFDPKSSTAMSKCMITGAAGSTVYYNLKLRHPTLDMPIIDYNVALLIQPMLVLRISIGVIFNVVFPDWLVTVLLIIIFIFTSTKAFLKGVDTWKKETITLKESAKEKNNSDEIEYRAIPTGPENHKDVKSNLRTEVPILENVCWKELGLLVFVWVVFLILQIAKNYMATCSTLYWLLNLLQMNRSHFDKNHMNMIRSFFLSMINTFFIVLVQIPVAVGVSLYEAVNLYTGKSAIASKGDAETQLTIHQLVIYCISGVVAGIVGGLLGLGGGFILGPLFLELGIPPQVSSATATFAMTFSASMSVVEYYLLRRFPVPYAIYFVVVATISAFVGQHVVRKIIIVLGRASIIIFVLAFTIFISAVSLGGVGISNMVNKIGNHEYMGFGNICKYEV